MASSIIISTPCLQPAIVVVTSSLPAIVARLVNYPNSAMMFRHCRLCAQLKNSEALVDLDNDQSKCKDFISKLRFLNATYVDISDHFGMPKTVCLDCQDSLDKSYEFLIKVQKAQSAFIPMQEIKREVVASSSDEVENKAEEELNFDIKEESENDSNEFEIQEIPDPNRSCKTEPLITEVVDNADPTLYDSDVMRRQNIKTNISQVGSVKISAALIKRLLTDKQATEKSVTCWKVFRWICGRCRRELPDVDSLRSHSLTVHGKCADYMCSVCEKSFNYTEMIGHAKVHHPALVNRCHHCDTLTNTEEFNSHVNGHLQSAKTCPSCGETFPDDTSLQNHQDSMKDKLRKGRKKKAPEKDRTCPTCNKVFKNLGLLNRHMETHNTMRKRDFTCEHCGKMFYTKNTLTLHLYTHTKGHPYACHLCNTSFNQKRSLRRHIVTHSEEKPFACETCGRKFHLKSQLKKHKVIHTDTFPYSCEYCKKGFNFKSTLNTHLRQHTGVKPYSCHECGRAFTNWPNYSKHMKRRHNKDISKKT